MWDVGIVCQIFVTDKKRIKMWGFKDKPNRIKKALMKEMGAMNPGECVLIIGTTSNPQVCMLPNIGSNFMLISWYGMYR